MICSTLLFLFFAGCTTLHVPDLNCEDFTTHAEAQAAFEAAGGPNYDTHRLDADHDGIACEALR